MAIVDTTPVTEIGGTGATANGDLTDNEGENVTQRGFVFDTASHGDPGDVAPDDSDYASNVLEGTGGDQVNVQSGVAAQAAGTSVSTIDLDTPVPVGKSFPIVSLNASAYQASRTMATAVLSTIVSGHYTQLVITRSFSTDTAVEYAWQVISGEGFTVQSGVANISNLSQLDVSISAVDLSKTFAVVSMRTNNTGSIAGYTRAKFTSTTNLQLNKGAADTSGFVAWYVVEWEGASVQSGESVYSGAFGTINETISAVDLSKTFVMYSWSQLSFSTNVGIILTRAQLTSTTNLQLFKALQSASEHGTVNWFVVSHPNINVQSGLGSAAGVATDTEDLASAVNLARTFLPTPFQGNGSVNTNGNLTLHDGYHTRRMTDADTIEFERGTSNNTLTPSYFVVEDQVITYAEEPYSLPLLGLSAETTYYVRAFVRGDGAYYYGDEVSFETAASPDIARRGSAVSILQAM